MEPREPAPPAWHTDEKAWGEKRATLTWSRDEGPGQKNKAIICINMFPSSAKKKR